MEITDSDGRATDSASIRLAPEEVTELLVAASQLDDGTADTASVESVDGTLRLVVRKAGEEPNPLERHFDWWVGIVVLLVTALVIVGAFTVASSVVRLLF